MTNPPPITNDKLPEEMQEQIKNNVIAFCKADNDISENWHSYFAISRKSYIAGATAWAPRKVKFDATEAAYLTLQMEQMLLRQQAQRMADALELVANSPEPANEREMVSWILTARALAVEQLQQFKDGKGKEVVDE